METSKVTTLGAIKQTKTFFFLLHSFKKIYLFISTSIYVWNFLPVEHTHR